MAMQRAATKDGGLPLLILDVIHAAEKDGKTTIVQSVDKPYDVQSYSEADAVLAVYGCKGSTVDPTEALTGGITASEAACGPNIMAGIEVALGVYGARGMLAVNVPRFADGGYTEEIVFERGRGLFYDAVR